MLNWARYKFTNWYIKCGYTFGYDFSNTKIIGEYPFSFPLGEPKAYWMCPKWVKPLLFLFSPSIYQVEAIGKIILEGFTQGLNAPCVKLIGFDALRDEITAVTSAENGGRK